MQKIVAPISYRSASNRHYLLIGLALITGSLITGCVVGPPPYEDYTLARAARQSARDAESAQYSANYWSRSDDTFQKGQKAWNDGDFDVARKYFKQSIEFSERAENVSRLKKFKTGGGF